MNRTVLLAAIFLTFATIANATFDLRVMSFNIRYGTADDGPNHWDKRKELVVEMLRQSDAEIIGTQECLDFQADYLVEQLPHYRWFGIGREQDCSSEHMAVLYNATVLAPIESGTFWLSESPDVVGSISWNSACRRTATWAKFYHMETKMFFYFVNTHLDHKSEPARQGGAKVLRDFIKKLPNSVPVILTGDFNSKAGDSEAYKILTDAKLSDTWLTASQQVGPPITWSAFKAPEPNTDRRIDWILTGGAVTAKKCETVLFNQDGRYPSDHFPVSAILSIGQ